MVTSYSYDDLTNKLPMIPNYDDGLDAGPRSSVEFSIPSTMSEAFTPFI